ncbi:MAG: epoxyqueuosine reductase [Deltaproteobacteria bacterium]|nr:MAG: epoxyqueuosine reductase [Deltaproteobacteria bacterium]
MVTNHHEENPVDWLIREIADFVATSPLNTLGLPGGEVAWDSPLVGFSRGDDAIYLEYKGHIGDFYWTPLEIFQLTFPDVAAAPEDLSVISWVLPQTRATKDENADQKVYPSTRWAAARDLGEKFNVALRQHVVKTLLDEAVQAVAPMLSPHWYRQDSQGYGFASTWSERHAAHAGGLGTFGLCDGLITPLGKAIRAGSVVARLEVPVTPRPYQNHQAYCLFFSHGICKKCAGRCPVKAIRPEGHDKIRCRDHLGKARSYVRKKYGLENKVGCGLCQVGIPCESRIPTPAEG